MELEELLRKITINTKNHPQKLQKMRADGNPDRLPDYLVPYVKNYVDHPKDSGYQSYHVCATPEYSSSVNKPTLPPHIIPPLRTEYSFEYQIRTIEMDDEAEHGTFCHDNYKKIGSYHRLSIPFYIEYSGENNRFKSLNLEESCRKHFGHVPFLRIYDPNGVYLRDISLIDFRDTFTSYEREAIIDGKKRIFYHPNHGLEVSDEPNQLAVVDNFITPIFLSTADLEKLSSGEESYQSILEASNATDSILSLSGNASLSSKPVVEIYVVETSEDRQKSKQTIEINTPKTVTDEEIR